MMGLTTVVLCVRCKPDLAWSMAICSHRTTAKNHGRGNGHMPGLSSENIAGVANLYEFLAKVRVL